jgi:hypothetical protein
MLEKQRATTAGLLIGLSLMSASCHEDQKSSINNSTGAEQKINANKSTKNSNGVLVKVEAVNEVKLLHVTLLDGEKRLVPLSKDDWTTLSAKEGDLIQISDTTVEASSGETLLLTSVKKHSGKNTDASPGNVPSDKKPPVKVYNPVTDPWNPLSPISPLGFD